MKALASSYLSIYRLSPQDTLTSFALSQINAVSKMAFPLILCPASQVTKSKAVSTESSSQLEVKSPLKH